MTFYYVIHVCMHAKGDAARDAPVHPAGPLALLRHLPHRDTQGRL